MTRQKSNYARKCHGGMVLVIWAQFVEGLHLELCLGLLIGWSLAV